MGNKYSITFFCVLLLISCNNKKNDSSVKTPDTIYVSNRDSIIYELPEKASKSLMSKIEGKKVSHCGLLNNEGKYIFSFPYDDKTYYTKRDTILLEKTNRYLKLGEKYYPIITEFDDIFSNIPREQGYINDFNFCFIAVNARGEVLDGFAY
jgi:hypothetical protein